MEERLKYFVKYLFAPIIVGMTFFGSTLGLVILSYRKLKQIGPRNIYRYLLAIEYLNVLIMVEYLIDSYDLDYSLASSWICKLYWFVSYMYGPIPAMLLVYISMERYISIAHPHKRFVLRKKRNQLIYFVAVIVYNSGIYLFLIFEVDVRVMITPGDENSSMLSKFDYCGFVDLEEVNILDYIDFLNRLLIPFVLNLLCTVLLIQKIFRSRKKIKTQNKSFKKDMRFSASCILLNIVYLALNLPFSIYILIPNNLINITLSNSFEYLLYFSLSLDFYIIFITNSLFRSGFFKLFQTNLFNK